MLETMIAVQSVVIAYVVWILAATVKRLFTIVRALEDTRNDTLISETSGATPET